MASFGFPKSERLNKEKDIQELFEKGSSFYMYPLRVNVLSNPGAPAHQVVFSVPKRNFKKATDRNLIKRRMREAYRLHKADLASDPKFQMAYIYTAKELLPFRTIEEKMVLSLRRIQKAWRRKKESLG